MLAFFLRYALSRGGVLLLVCAAATAFSGCLSSPPSREDYVATIERIDRLSVLPSEYYSPRRGPTPVTCLYLRVSSASERARGESLRVFLTDLYSPAIHGRRGDTVTFFLTGAIPASGEIEFESLGAYHVANGG